MTKPLTIAVIGAGIGGSAAALSLLRAGFAVELFEQAERFGEIGAGIQISPNASRILHRLVPESALTARAVRPIAVHQRRWEDGRTLQRAPLGEAIAAAYGAPYYHFHRADLLTALAEALPKERVHFGHRLAGFAERGDGVVARFANGTEIAADLLIGADGIRSAVRQQLFGADAPRFTGCIAYRGLVPFERVAPLGVEVVSGNWMGPRRHFVHYVVGGGRFLNFVAVIERDAWTKESWTEPGAIADCLGAYEGWHPQVRSIMAAAPETFIWGLFDRLPLPRWSEGRVSLLGDACHPMLPFMAQGAAMAIEDGAALAACLAAGADDVPAALRRYEAIRLPRASRLQELSRANKTRFHLPDGPEQLARDVALAAHGDRSIAATQWLYGHDAEKIE
ncbi:MAG TPA: FAD-dependent monooxygenase [Stellaceae bacterium]|nr:FAD-dependent monooxygenase [Stellaceae bacterium]